MYSKLSQHEERKPKSAPFLQLPFVQLQNLPQPAARPQQLARQPRGIIRGKERRNRRNILRLSDTPKRSLRHSVLLEIASDKSSRMRALGLNHSRIDRVHANLLWPKLLRENARNRIHRALGRRVDAGVRRSQRRDHRPDIDDASALRPEVLQCFLGRKQQPKHIQIEDFLILLGRNLLERSKRINPSVVHQRIQTSKVLLHLGKDLANIFLLGE